MLRPLALALLVLPLAAFALAAPAATAAPGEVVARLPSPSDETGAFFDGESVFVLAGGRYGNDFYRLNTRTLAVDELSRGFWHPEALGGVAWTGREAIAVSGELSTTAQRETHLYSFVPATQDLEELDATVPTGLTGTSAVFDGKHVYVFGGGRAYGSTEIRRFDPESREIRVIEASLPTGRAHTSAVWTGEHVFVFGGSSGRGSPLDEIVRFTPKTGEVKLMTARLPFPVSGSAAVWDGRHAYVIGGSEERAEVARYDPAADVADLAGFALPSARAFASAAWDGERAFVFGGRIGYELLDEVVAFDLPDRGAARAPVDAPPPVRAAEGRVGLAAVWADDHALVFGGRMAHGSYGTNEILRYDPSEPGLLLLRDALPTPVEGVAAVWTGEEAIVLGGKTIDHVRLDAILRYAPGEKPRLEASRLPEPREGAVAVWDGRHVYVIGGVEAGFEPKPSPVLRFEPATGRLDTLRAATPSGLEYAAVAWDGRHAFVFGGRGSDAVLRFDPAAERVDTMRARLPAPCDGPAAAWTGKVALVVCATYDDDVGRLLEYDPAADAFRELAAPEGLARSDAAAVWDGRSLHVMGGDSAAERYPASVATYTPPAGSDAKRIAAPGVALALAASLGLALVLRRRAEP